MHPRFDEIVEFYRILRNLGFAYHLAKACNKKLMSKILDNVFKTIGTD